MPRTKWISLVAALALTAAPVVAQTTPPARPATKPPPVIQSFVVTGSTTPTDLDRLRATLEKVAGVISIDVRKSPNGALLTVKGDVLYTLLEANAVPLGYAMQQTPVRFFAAAGPRGDIEISHLRVALQAVPGVDRVALSPIARGAAVRVSGIAGYADLVAAAKDAGFGIRQMGSYAASGPEAAAQLKRLRATLGKVPGVEQVEMQAMIGGATVLLYGTATPTAVAQAGKAVGYEVWSLNNGSNSGAEYRITGADDAAKRQKLTQLLQGMEGIATFEVLTADDGPRLAVSGERLKTDRIAAAAAEAGFGLTLLDNVALPTLTPKAGRGTPADYEYSIVEDPIKPGEIAPTFTLLSKDGKSRISLADYRNKRPVVLLFGSCT